MIIFIIILSIYMILFVLQIYLTPRHGKLELIMGKAGSGKSTLIAHLVRQANKKKRKVFCNHHVLGATKFSHEWLGKYMLEDCTIIIDEAQICFDNRDFKSFTKELKFFFSNYRHFQADIYVVSQSWEDLDIKIRRQAKKISIMKGSIIPFTIMLQRVKMKFGVSEDKTDIITQFGTTIIPIIGWTLKFNFTVWHYFDSYSKPILPKIPEEIEWGAVKERIKISKVIKSRFLYIYTNFKKQWSNKKVH